MKYSTSIIGAVALAATSVSAFPTLMKEMLERGEPIPLEMEAAAEFMAKQKRAVGFNAALQRVSTTGDHKFVAPNLALGDQRGPCPGLNAMANHGYIPHNGYATIPQFVKGTFDVFGMGTDLATFLAVYGSVFDGDLTGWSIGGPVPLSGALGATGLLSTPQGISGSHNKYESDVSPTRPDLYQYGNDYKVIISQFQELFSMQPDASTANYNLDVLTAFRASRFQQSIKNNPYFFNGPFSGVLVQPAAYTFIYRFMGNKSAEHPDGVLNQDVLKSFFAIEGKSGSFTWNEGHERIPDNWYKRAIGDEYTIPFFNNDLTAAALKHPEFLSIGGNTGKVNTFSGVDVTDLTGGVYNSASLLQGNNAACFAYQSMQQLQPDILKGIFNSMETATEHLAAANSAFASLGCPQLSKIDASQFGKYPGAKIPNAVSVTPGAVPSGNSF